MAQWFRSQIGWILTAVTLLAAACVSWGRMSQICTAVNDKADKSAVTREMDQIQKTLDRIESKIDNHVLK